MASTWYEHETSLQDGGHFGKWTPSTEQVERSYSKADGLQGDTFYYNSGVNTSQGEVWFGGYNGPTRFHPDKLTGNPFPPPVVLTALTQGGQTVNWDHHKVAHALQEITLDWQSPFFEFEYAALNFTIPEKNRYAYKLEGFDTDWYDAGVRRFGRYSGLEEGVYVLNVRGSNNDGVWSVPPTTLNILVNPHLPEGMPVFSQTQLQSSEMLRLPYNRNTFFIEARPRDFSQVGQDVRYRLEEFDQEWQDMSSHRHVQYRNVPDGEYTFRVQAGEQEQLSKTITVLPPWWENVWFQGTLLLLIIGLAGGGYRWRVSSLERQRRKLELIVAERTQQLEDQNVELAFQADELRKSRQEAEIAKDKAEVANQAKSTFLANMTHELRSPLNAILGFAQVITRSKRLDPENMDNLSVITRSGEHLLSLINQVLDLSKIEAGRMTLNPREFNLGRLLDDVEDMFRLKAEDKHLSLVFERDPDVPLHLRTDELKLRQVIINLLNNALKFTERGGIAVRIRVRSEARSLRSAVEGGKKERHSEDSVPHYELIQFEIEDTGPGVAPEELSKLFEAFERTASGKQSQEGTGLGHHSFN